MTMVVQSLLPPPCCGGPLVQVNLPQRILQRCGAVLADETHPLHQALERTFERLSYQSLTPSDFRYIYIYSVSVYTLFLCICLCVYTVSVCVCIYVTRSVCMSVMVLFFCKWVYIMSWKFSMIQSYYV